MPPNREIDSHTSPVTTDVPTENPIEVQIARLNEQMKLLRGAIDELRSSINAAVDRATQGDAFSDSSYRRWSYSSPRLPPDYWPGPIVDRSLYDLRGNQIGLRGQRRRMSGR